MRRFASLGALIVAVAASIATKWNVLVTSVANFRETTDEPILLTLTEAP